jgi:hypothetical protein
MVLALRKPKQFMNKTPVEGQQSSNDELLAEYSFDYQKAKPNRFASRIEMQRTVVLDEDVAKVFTTPEAVNKVLRALIESMPQSSVS